MLSKQYKLKSNAEISQVFKNGKTVKSSFLFLRYRSNSSEEIKIAFSIGLKYSKKAVDRNRAKRVLRVTSKKLIDQIKPGFDLVFYFDKNFHEEISANADLLKIMRACLLQAKILN